MPSLSVTSPKDLVNIWKSDPVIKGLLKNARKAGEGMFELDRNGECFQYKIVQHVRSWLFRKFFTVVQEGQSGSHIPFPTDEPVDHAGRPLSMVLFSELLPGEVDFTFQSDTNPKPSEIEKEIEKKILKILTVAQTYEKPDLAVMDPTAHLMLIYARERPRIVSIDSQTLGDKTAEEHPIRVLDMPHYAHPRCPSGEIYYLYTSNVFFVFHKDYVFKKIADNLYLSMLGLAKIRPNAVFKTTGWNIQ
ncbi:hypothetical protein EM20IM_02335 [Candidatus Methylacidiphilum infernorum]|uniref:Uncharacterized protein n=1 Tax=Candidatus Methylacidiphilum infernorum TaxID=511746 RepID=A0ABX7PW15_9BACT|nr:hypothetical protein [Candidatus Methylacidiphilum infernorum]QSR87200.1 hypothetical protein EM20IM_02335 [Candidatus Methylacidiphilum infernorum]